MISPLREIDIDRANGAKRSRERGRERKIEQRERTRKRESR